MKDYIYIEVPCACGCGFEAEILFRGVPVPKANGIIHYRNYIRNIEQAKENARMKLSVLEGFHSEEDFQRARRSM